VHTISTKDIQNLNFFSSQSRLIHTHNHTPTLTYTYSTTHSQHTPPRQTASLITQTYHDELHNHPPHPLGVHPNSNRFLSHSQSNPSAAQLYLNLHLLSLQHLRAHAPQHDMAHPQLRPPRQLHMRALQPHSWLELERHGPNVLRPPRPCAFGTC
jgi:hypothetical protein